MSISEYTMNLQQAEMKADKQLFSQKQGWEPKVNELRMKKGCNFWSIEQNFQTLYNNFHLLSYFAPRCQIKILNRFQGEESDKFNFIQQFQYKGSENVLYMVEDLRYKIFKVYKNGKNQIQVPLRIMYSVYKQTNSSDTLNFIPQNKLTQITVQFETQIIQLSDKSNKTTRVKYFINGKAQQRTYRQAIRIKIKDNNGWLKNTFEQTYLQKHQTRISEFNKSKIGQFQYFYKQPISIRHKIIDKQHISLALQGGGCKGVQYIGAYKALKKNKPNAKITSIIGSSAGAIIGLAICCQLQPEIIMKQVCQKKLSKVTQDKINFKNQKIKSIMNQKFQIIKKFLEEFQFFQPKLNNILFQVLEDKQFQKNLLKLIGLMTNQKIKQLFSYNETIEGKTTQHLNLAGFIEGSLMSGQIIKNIGVQCISLYLAKLRKENNQKLQKILNKQPYKGIYMQKSQKFNEIAQKMTMKDLYYLTQTQFTATAVDLKNNCLRFLNQKTSPDLPVCVAVQMSGSFPIAFKAQKWKKQWGKYYIHFNSMRKQIDLTGCQLTDGGTLANFPIKYLDNQDMRPMYFSHIKTDKTVMYGIGLVTDITHEPKDKQIQQTTKQLARIVKNKIGLTAPICEWLSHIFCCKKQIKQNSCSKSLSQVFKCLKQIPLVDFLLRLLQTFSTSKDNLIEQCFSHSSYQTNTTFSYQKQIQNRPKPNQIVNKVRKLRQKITELVFQSSDKELEKTKYRRPLPGPQQIFQKYIDNILYLKMQTSSKKYNQVQLMQIKQAMYFNFSTVFYYLLNEQTNNQVKNTLYVQLRQSIKRFINFNVKDQCLIDELFLYIKKIKWQKVFVLCEVQKDMQNLNKICQILIEFFNKIKSNKSSQQSLLMDRVLKNIYETESSQISSFLMSLNQYEVNGNKNEQKYEIEGNRNILITAAKKMSKLNDMIITTPIQKYKKIMKRIQYSQIPQLFIHYEAISHRQLIQSYTFQRIAKQKNKMKALKNISSSGVSEQLDGIHIVLQSIALSEFYFHQYYLTIKDVLLQYNTNKKQKTKTRKSLQQKAKQLPDFLMNLGNLKQKSSPLKVTTMTGTGYHSIIMFLHASDLPQENVSNEVWKIRELVKLDKNRLKYLQQKNWAKITPILMRQIQNEAIRKKKDIFEYIEQQIDVKNSQKSDESFRHLKQQVIDHIQNIRCSNQQMMEAIQNSLNYVVSTLIQIQAKQDKDKVKKTFEKLKLNKDPYMSLNEQYYIPSIKLKKLWGMFVQKFQTVIQYLFYNSPLVVDQIGQMLTPEQRQQAWKSIIISQILTGHNIKDYIIKILKQLELNPNTTLKQFYDYSSKKIQLNFSVIQQSFVTIFNHVTRPNMPVWAAILAASSIPQFFPSVFDKSEWKNVHEKDYKKREVLQYFKPKNKPYRTLCSSQTITRLPLDLLQNNKFKSKITTKKNEVYLILNFSQFRLSFIPKSIQNRQIQVKPLKIGEILSSFVSFKGILYELLFKKSLKTTDEASNIQGLKLLTSLPSVKQKLRILQLYIESHDNLIVKLYKEQLVQMPIRLDTLDFHLLTTKSIDQKTKEVKQGLSRLCHDAIMQGEYILSQKLQSLHSLEHEKKVIQQHNNKILKKNNQEQQGLQMIGNLFLNISNNLITNVSKKEQPTESTNVQKKQQQEEQEISTKVLYFRVQSYSASKDLRDHEQQLLDSDMSSYIIHKDQTIYQREQNSLKIRFLSMLNPSRQIHETFFIYIQQTTETGRQFVRVKSQSVLINKQKLNKQQQKLKLKIEYPSLDLRSIQARYFRMDLRQLFEINRKLAEQKRGREFGFVYCLKIDKLYFNSQDNSKLLDLSQSLNSCKANNSTCLLPDSNYTSDYLNCSHKFKQFSPRIGIQSDVKGTLYQKIICNKCTFILKRVYKSDKKVYYQCPGCGDQSPASQNFKLLCNPIQGKIQCLLGHIICKVQRNTQGYENKKVIFCSLCGRGYIDNLWYDKSCSIHICQNCRVQNMQMNMGL